MFAAIFFSVVCWGCALVFGLIALWAYRRPDPMHFWSGSTIKPETITDIPAYNRANGIMWVIYAVVFIILGILSFYSVIMAAIAMGIVCVPGTGILIYAWMRIHKKYSR